MKTQIPLFFSARFNRPLLTFGMMMLAALPPMSAGPIVVTPTGSALTLATTILGPGVTISSATLTGGNLDNPLSSAATFTGGLSTGIGIDQGILLTSGYASNVSNTNTSSAITGIFGTFDSLGNYSGGPGDPVLDALIPGYTTFDATSLDIKFAFTSAATTNNLYFNFAFGSDEYNEWANSPYNDVFGFFVDGTALSNNIAVLPATTTPISIDNVNGGNPFGTNPHNPQYFKNNEGGQYPFEYDGFTTVFTVSALNLGPGEHTIKLAIADAGDPVLDSGVFIQAGSFSNTIVPPDDDPFEHVPDAGSSVLLAVLGLLGLAGFGRRFAQRVQRAE